MFRTKFFTGIFIIIFSPIFISAQLSGMKWVLLSDGENEISYIDTTQIKILGNQISVWSLTRYRKPVMMNNIQKQVKEYKTQYLFNRRNNRYSVVGNIYYDNKGKLIDQPIRMNLPGRRGMGVFSKKIPDNSLIKLIMEKASQYLETKQIVIGESDYLAMKQSESAAPEKLIPKVETKDSTENKITQTKISSVSKDTSSLKNAEKTFEPPVDSLKRLAEKDITEEENKESGEAVLPVMSPAKDIKEIVSKAIKETVETISDTSGEKIIPPASQKNIDSLSDKISRSKKVSTIAEKSPEKTLIDSSLIVSENKQKSNLTKEPQSKKEENLNLSVKKNAAPVMKEVIETIYREIYDPVSDTYKKIPVGTRKVIEESTPKDLNQPEEKQRMINQGDYDAGKERMVRTGIYTDGKLYCIQLESGRNKTAAEARVTSLRDMRHNAFLTEAVVKGKKYYRVRIGFFNSLREAINYRAKVR